MVVVKLENVRGEERRRGEEELVQSGFKLTARGNVFRSIEIIFTRKLKVLVVYYAQIKNLISKCHYIVKKKKKKKKKQLKIHLRWNESLGY